MLNNKNIRESQLFRKIQPQNVAADCILPMFLVDVQKKKGNICFKNFQSGVFEALGHAVFRIFIKN